MCLWACSKYTYSDSSHACAKWQPGICSPLIYSVVSNYYVSGQRRSWSATRISRLIWAFAVRIWIKLWSICKISRAMRWVKYVFGAYTLCIYIYIYIYISYVFPGIRIRSSRLKIQCSNHWAKESTPWRSCQRLNIYLEAMRNLPRQIIEGRSARS